MPEYFVVQQAIYSPTHCFFCLDFTGPFLDTGFEDPAYGHIYICGPRPDRVGCIGQFTHLFDGLLKEEVAALRAERDRLALELEAEQERERTVSLTYDDLVKAMEESSELLSKRGA